MSLTAESPEAVAHYLAHRTRPQSLASIAEGLGLGVIARTTLWRRMRDAQEQGLVEMVGEGRAARYKASETIRRNLLIEQINEPLAKRPRVSYQEGFLGDYEPNLSRYLDPKSLARLHRQCPPGSMAFTALSQRDQSLFLCGISYASSKMEGNSYDMIATEKLLLEGVEREGATPEETTMVMNHHDAARFLIDNINIPAQENDLQISPRDLKSIHGLLSTDLLRDPLMCGSVRHAPVTIHGSSFIPLSIHESLEIELATICEKASQIKDPYEKAFFLLVHLPYLQPFEDCNKRTSRMACNIPLLAGGVIPMSWLDVDQAQYNNGLLGVYERNNTSLLSEVFVDCFIRSTERFDIMQRTAVPTEVQVRYRRATREAIRAIVLEGDASTPEGIDAKDLVLFQSMVDQELSLLRSGNVGAVVRHGLREGDVQQWLDEIGERGGNGLTFEPPPRNRSG